MGIHYGRAVYRDGDYFGTEVNLTHRVVARALGGEVLVTTAVADAIGDSAYLELDPIGRVELKGFPRAGRAVLGPGPRPDERSSPSLTSQGRIPRLAHVLSFVDNAGKRRACRARRRRCGERADRRPAPTPW